MLESYIKYYFMSICICYVFSKIVNANVDKKRRILDSAICFLLSGIVFIIRESVPYLTTSVLFFLICIYMIISYNLLIKINIVVSVLSLALSYLLFFMATILVSVVFGIVVYLAKIDNKYIDIILMLFVGIVQNINMLLMFRIKPFKKGMPFILRRMSNTLGVVIAGTSVFLTSFFTILDKKRFMCFMILFISATFGLFLVIWWKKQFKISYIINRDRAEIKDLEREIESLKKDNEILATLIHKDNKLIPAMELCVREILKDSGEAQDVNLRNKATRLADDLNKLASERKGILDSNINERCATKSTGSLRLDAVSTYMYKSAKVRGIDFDIDIDIDVKEMIKKTVNEEKLVTVVSDLLENAFIATEYTDIKKVRLVIGKEHNDYYLSIYDSGILFEPYTIENAGKIKATTHADNGGSGIGLMTIFSIIRECLGSFEMDETVCCSNELKNTGNANSYLDNRCNIRNEDYTKRVTVRFDYKNRYVVNSYRKEIIDLGRNNTRIVFNEYKHGSVA